MPRDIHDVMDPAYAKKVLRYRPIGAKAERPFVFARHTVEKFFVPSWGEIAKHMLTQGNINVDKVSAEEAPRTAPHIHMTHIGGKWKDEAMLPVRTCS
jgi:hypothetical protein